MFKSQLQELLQKKGWKSVQYESVKEGLPHLPKFQATVLVNGVSYSSERSFSNLKAAENDAARVALQAIGSSEGVSQAPVHSTGLCKNLLQEYAQKSGFSLPIYRTERQGEEHAPVFVTTVEVGNMFYAGGPAKQKKESEIKAAKVALLAIQSLNLAPRLMDQPAKVFKKEPASPPGRKRYRPEEELSEPSPSERMRRKSSPSSSHGGELYRSSSSV